MIDGHKLKMTGGRISVTKEIVEVASVMITTVRLTAMISTTPLGIIIMRTGMIITVVLSRPIVDQPITPIRDSMLRVSSNKEVVVMQEITTIISQMIISMMFAIIARHRIVRIGLIAEQGIAISLAHAVVNLGMKAINVDLPAINRGPLLIKIQHRLTKFSIGLQN